MQYIDTPLYDRQMRKTETYNDLMAILPGEPGSAGFPLDSSSSYILFNTVSPCPSQTWETVMKDRKEEWREITFCEG